MIWIGFGLSLVVLLGLARFSIWGAMFLGALVLGIFSLPLAEVLGVLAQVFGDLGVVALALAVGFIPLIGAALEKGGWFGPLLALIPGGRRTVFAAVPALFGLLPIPGGALLSAPILEQTGGGTPEERAAANVWFRHVLLFFYPMASPLMVGAKLAGLDLWTIIPYQIPWALLSAGLGGIFLLGPFRGPKPTRGTKPTWRSLFPVGVLLLAPVLDFLLKKWTSLPAPEVATFAALGASFLLSVYGVRLRDLPSLLRAAAPWRFSLIVAGMFLYLGVFQASGLPTRLAGLDLPLLGVVVGLGILMGVATGRQQAAVSVVIPLYLAAKGGLHPLGFSVIYQTSYLGYLLSPLHPCLTVSAQYAGTTLGAVWRRLLRPSLVLLASAIVAGLFLL